MGHDGNRFPRLDYSKLYVASDSVDGRASAQGQPSRLWY